MCVVTSPYSVLRSAVPECSVEESHGPPNRCYSLGGLSDLDSVFGRVSRRGRLGSPWPGMASLRPGMIPSASRTRRGGPPETPYPSVPLEDGASMAARAYGLAQRVPPNVSHPRCGRVVPGRGAHLAHDRQAWVGGRTAYDRSSSDPGSPRQASPVASAPLGVTGAEHHTLAKRRVSAHLERQLRLGPRVQRQPPRLEGPSRRRPDFGGREPAVFAPRAGRSPPQPVIGQREEPGSELVERRPVSLPAPGRACAASPRFVSEGSLYPPEPMEHGSRNACKGL